MQKSNYYSAIKKGTPPMFNELLDWKNKFQISLSTTKEQLAKKKLFLQNNPEEPSLLFVGMGASGIIGTLFQLILQKQKKNVSVKTCNSNRIPQHLAPNTLAFIGSFSGETWETLAACRLLQEKQIPLVILAHKGELAHIAQKEGFPLFEIPECTAPRASLGSFMGIIWALLEQLQILDSALFSSDSVIHCLESAIATYQNRAYFAPFLRQHIDEPLLHIIGITDDSDAAAYRAQTQFNENSKIPAIFQPFPELCHNAIVGITGSKNPQAVLFMLTEQIMPTERKGIMALKKLLDEYKIPWYHISVRGQSWLEQLIDLIIWADFASFYLAEQKNIPVSPVKAIDRLKQYFTTV
jgi:glucose/mannose-6-phosphate isomerase